MLALWMYQWPWSAVALPPLPACGAAAVTGQYSGKAAVLANSGTAAVISC